MSNATPNLGIAHIASNQSQKEVTANTAFDELDQAMTDSVNISVAGTGTVTAASTTVLAFNLILTGVQTGAGTLNLVAAKHFYRVTHNATGGYSVKVAVSGGTGVNMVNGQTMLVYCDGVNVYAAETKGSQVALVDSTNNSADVGATTFYTSAASGFGGPGMYEVKAFAIVTTVDGASSTLPSIVITFHDQDNNTSQTLTLTPTNSGNGLTTYQSAGAPIMVKASTAIQWSTSGYASGTPATMKFAVHITLSFVRN